MRTFVFSDVAGAYEQDFWTVDAVRAAQTYPPVWHAGLALTEMYRSIADTGRANGANSPRQMRAMEQYGHAVRSILDVTRQTEISLADKEAVLLSSILLIGFCCLQNNTQTKVAHVRNALQIFNKWRIWETFGVGSQRGNIVNMGSLVRQFQRFEVQGAVSGQQGLEHDGNIREAVVRSYSSSFTSITAAFTEFFQLSLPFLIAIEAAAAAGRENRPAPAIVYAIRQLFTGWKTKFKSLSESEHRQSNEEECFLTLEIWSIAIEICLFLHRTGDADDELMYDVWNPAFNRMVSVAEELFTLMAKAGQARQARLFLQPFSFTTSVCEAMGTIWRCRDGIIRRRAILLLRKWPYEDGITDPGLLASCIEARMLVEEEGFLCDDSMRPEGCACIAPVYICALHRCICSHFQATETGKGLMQMLMRIDAQGQRNTLHRSVNVDWQHYKGSAL